MFISVLDMKEPTLSFIDLEGLVTKLNSAIARSEGSIELGEFKHKEPKRNPFLYGIRGKELETLGKYPLIQTVEGRGLFGFWGLDSEINLGYIFLEAGYTGVKDHNHGRYETIRLRIKQPLELKNGDIIPNCSVKLIVEAEDVWGEVDKKRKDHIKCGKLVYLRDDLTNVLPTEWFLTKSVNDYELKPAETRQ